MARVLVYDIETAPNLAYVWGKWEQNVIAFQHEWYMLCFAYKWLGERAVHSVALPDFELYDREPSNDRDVVATLRELFDEADVTITHNGKTFDHKKARARMIVHGLVPPSPTRDIDTLQVARKQFAFNSNRLDDLCKALGLPHKSEVGGFKTWLGCMNGDERAWNRMRRYNKRDVRILEQLYEQFKPWMPNHPLIHDGAGRCRVCGHDDLIIRGYRYMAATKRARYQCKRCYTYMTDNKSIKLETELRPI